MSHLLSELTSYHDPYWCTLVVLAAMLGTALTLLTLRRRAGLDARWRLALAAGGGLVAAGFSWIAFLAAFKSAYPQIPIAIPAPYIAAALATSAACSGLAAGIAVFGRRSGRNVLLAGSIMAFGFSGMIFTGMSGMVSPFALSYDLGAVLTVMVLGATLMSFSLWENGNTARRRPFLTAVGLGIAGVVCIAFGSLAAILSFGDWMDATAQVDDLTSSPLLVVGAAEAVAVLVLSLVGSLVDNRVAARDKLEANRLRQLADSTFEAILIHKNGVVLDGNEALAALLGISSERIAGRALASFLPDAENPSATAPDASERVEAEIVRAGGASLPVEMLSRPIQYRGEVAVVTALRDISERRASEARIRFLAHHDMLTALPNRVLLKERLDAEIAAGAASPFAVLCLDLDGFKLVNDSFGHAAGDELLRQVASRLRDNMQDGEFVSRIGGDEFVLLQPGRPQPEAASDLAQRIVASLLKPFDLDGRQANIGTSIGIAIHPADGHVADHLLKRADIALYRAKHSGRGCFRHYDADLDHAVDDRPQLEQELRSAMANDELDLAYQPIFDRDERLVGFEALMRWRHPILGDISPARFIPLTETSKLILQMGEWALHRACRTAASWPFPYRIAVNLSPIQILEKNFVGTIRAILADTGLAPERLELEITEGVLVQDVEAASGVIRRLHALGIRIVLDDFGTGYSSLSYLHRFPFQKLKIDRSFIRRLSDERSAQVIVKAIISMGRDLEIEVTAEGVETVDQLQRLRAQGCDELQGYLFSRPLTAEAAADFLVRRGAEDGLARLNKLRAPVEGKTKVATPAA